MMLPFPDCPLKEQSGLGQQRDELLLHFIHICCQKTSREIQVRPCFPRLLETINNTCLKKHL